jgi:hypothetical protein
MYKIGFVLAKMEGLTATVAPLAIGCGLRNRSRGAAPYGPRNTLVAIKCQQSPQLLGLRNSGLRSRQQIVPYFADKTQLELGLSERSRLGLVAIRTADHRLGDNFSRCHGYRVIRQGPG